MKKGIDNKGFRAFPQSVQQNIVSNMRYGGRKYDNGGPLLTEFNEGGSHEENPLGGIPQGIGANGQMNVVEQGETKFEDYIFSDQLKLDKETAEELDLPKKYVGKTFAKISELMNRPNSRREDDSIETADKERNLAKLRDAQEAFKQAEVEAKLAEIDQLDPTAIPSLMQQGAQQQGAPGGLEGEMMQQQLSPEEQAMMQEQAMMEQQQMMAAQQGMDPSMDPAMQGQPMMAYGGPLSKYAFGGYTNSFASGGKLPKEILRARAKSHMSDAEANAYVDNYGSGGYMNKNAFGGYTNSFNMGGASGPFSSPYTGSGGKENAPTVVPFAAGGQMSGGCPPHHHKDNLGICVPNWYVGMLPEFLGMGAAAIGGGMYGAKTAKAKREKDAAVKQMMTTGIDPTMPVDPTIVVDPFQSENIDNNYAMGGNLFPIQSYRAGGNCYKCGGKMYGKGGNMYTTGGQLMAGIAGGAAGLAESLLPGQLGSMASQGIETLYNKLDKKNSDAREAQEARIFGNAADTVGLVGDIATGDVMGAGKNVLDLIENNADLNRAQTKMLNVANTGLGTLNMGKSLLGNYAPNMLQDTPISVSEGVEDVSEMLPTDFRYGGKLNSFANGGDLGDDNRYLVRSEPYTNADGKIAYRDVYKIGTRQISMDRQPGESIMTEKELRDYAIKEGLIKTEEPVDGQAMIDARRKASSGKGQDEILKSNTLDITSDLESTPEGLAFLDDEVIAEESTDKMGPSPEAPVGGILSLDEAQIYNPDLEAFDPSTIDEDDLTPEMKDMIIKQSPLSALAGYAPMAYNLYQGLSPVDKRYTAEDFFTPVSPDLVDYGESRKQAAQFGAGLMREARNKGVNPLVFQSAYQAGLGNVRKIAEAEANENVKRLQQNKQFNKQLETKAKAQAENLNIKSKTAKQEHIKEFMKGFYDNVRKQESDKTAAIYANMMNPYVNFEYQSYNPFRGLFNREDQTT